MPQTFVGAHVLYGRMSHKYILTKNLQWVLLKFIRSPTFLHSVSKSSSISITSSIRSAIEMMSSMNIKLFKKSPAIFSPICFQLFLLIAYSSRVVNNFDEIMLFCLTSFSKENILVVCWSTLTIVV